jgi:hypothetical protein
MNALSAMLGATRGVLSAPEVQPAQVAGALRPFSEKARNTAQSLRAQTPTTSSLRKIAARAATAITALGEQATHMSEYARQMSDLDSTNRAVDDNKRRVDQLEAEIEQFCDNQASKCVQLSGLLARFPAPKEQSEVGQDMAAWVQQLNQWTAELAKVDVEDAQLRTLVSGFRQQWQDVGTGLARLVVILDAGKKYEGLNQEFNVTIQQVNQAIADANATCQK